MKYITVPETVEVLSLSGDPIMGADGNPHTVSLQQFIIGRFVDKKFLGAKKGFDAALFVLEAKKEIDDQYDDGEPPKILKLETETHKQLVESIKNPEGGHFDTRWAHCLVPLMQCIIDATDKDPEKEDAEAAAKEDAETDAKEDPDKD